MQDFEFPSYHIVNFAITFSFFFISWHKVYQYCSIIIWQGSLIGSLLGGTLLFRPFSWKWSKLCIVCFQKQANSKFATSMECNYYYKLLTNLACWSFSGEHWPSVISVRTSLRPIFPCKALAFGQ